MMNECVDLIERFGKRFRVGFDPAYDPAHRPKDKLDRYMVMVCERGEVYPQGGELLVAEVEGRKRTRKRLLGLCHSETTGGRFPCGHVRRQGLSPSRPGAPTCCRRQLSDAQRGFGGSEGELSLQAPVANCGKRRASEAEVAG